MTEVYERVLSFLSDPSTDDFGALALAVFRHQFEECGPYRTYCESLDASPDSVRNWSEVPPVPIQAFKAASLCCGEPERVFLSTGTTQGAENRSRHALPDLRLYRASAVTGMRRFLFPDIDRIDMVSLIRPAADHPDSSLAQMVAWAAEDFGRDGIVECAAGAEPSFDLFVETLRRSERDGSRLAILTTTGALIHFFDYARSRSISFRLPHGSRLMDTGGGKGGPRPMSRKGILHAVWSAFAIPGYFAVNEYGMAELSSQYYDSVIRDRYDGVHRGRALVAPPWLRAVVVDPETLRPVADGEPGLVCHYDLANAGSAMAVLSEDLGSLDGAGLKLIGRAPAAEMRGCSFSAAEWRLA